jgi:hypothetical protein
MKTSALRVFAVLGLLAASTFSTFAATSTTLSVHVPFDFMVGTSSLPAGDYIILQDGTSGVLTFQSRNSHKSVAVLGLATDSSVSFNNPQLVFQRRNGHAVLTEIKSAGTVTEPAGVNALQAAAR